MSSMFTTHQLFKHPFTSSQWHLPIRNDIYQFAMTFTNSQRNDIPNVQIDTTIQFACEKSTNA